MFQLSSLIILALVAGSVRAYPPDYIPQRCQDNDGNLLPSATSCEDKDPMCPTLFNNNGTDVRAKTCNSEIEVLVEASMICAKTCKLCCERPTPSTAPPTTPSDPEPEPTPTPTPEPKILRCQNNDGTLLPSATDCEDKDPQCAELYDNRPDSGDVRLWTCNHKSLYMEALICAKTCKMCCERGNTTIPDSLDDYYNDEYDDVTPSEPISTTVLTTPEPFPLRCQNDDGTFLPSATDCEDYDELCPTLFKHNGTGYRGSLCDYTIEGSFMCAKTCKVCCERPKQPTIAPTTTAKPASTTPEPKILRCQNEDGTLLPSATDCEDKDPRCAEIHANPPDSGDVRLWTCNYKSLNMEALICAKTCKVCCERGNTTIPDNLDDYFNDEYDDVTPETEPESTTPQTAPEDASLLCQNDDGTLLPSATDCEDEDPICPILFQNNGTDVRAKACIMEGGLLVSKSALMCAKTCKICCKRTDPATAPPTTQAPAPTFEPVYKDDVYRLEKDVKPHCQNSDGTMMDSATTCEDKYPEPCMDMFGYSLSNIRPFVCYTTALRYFAVMWCPKTCSMCCEVPK